MRAGRAIRGALTLRSAPALALALALAMTAGLPAGCRVSSVSTDARPIAPDATSIDTGRDLTGEVAVDSAAPEAGADRGAPDGADDGATDTAPVPPCDLLLQDCPDPRKACYPADAQNGQTVCAFPGSGPSLTPCATSAECDVREVCAYSADAQTNLCAPLCDPSAADTGCAPGAACQPIPGYRAGYCAP